jgi:hypothetical protein
MKIAVFPSSLLFFILSARQVKALSILASKKEGEDVEKIQIIAKNLHFCTSIARTGMAPNYEYTMLVSLSLLVLF